jgi:hypothetical protein
MLFSVFRLGLQVLDFRNCAVPDAEKIIQILHKTPNAGKTLNTMLSIVKV